MKPAVLFVALLSTGNLSASESPAVNAALSTAKEGKPACAAGHDNALADGTVTIKPGETICVELQMRGDRIIPVAVVSVANQDSTLVLKAWNEPGKPDTFLTLHNPMDVSIRYEAQMLLPVKSHAEYTSSCPVMSRRFALEHWPYAITELTLSNFRVEPESNTMECR